MLLVDKGHGRLCPWAAENGGVNQRPHDAAAFDPRKPWLFERSNKWTKAMEVFVHV